MCIQAKGVNMRYRLTVEFDVPIEDIPNCEGNITDLEKLMETFYIEGELLWESVYFKMEKIDA